MSNVHVPPSWQIPEAQATPEEVFWNRRQLIKALGLGAIAGALPRAAVAATTTEQGMTQPALRRFGDRFPAKRNGTYVLGSGRVPTQENVAARYNNFYEFTTTKEKVWELARGYSVDPWRLVVRGKVKKPLSLSLDDVFGRFALEERLYHFRCVERWAMQVPWTGFPLRKLIEYCEPLSSAKYVRFVSVLDRKGLPGQKGQDWYSWPYYEGLRMDEAMNELAMVVVGIYGHALPMQHGAPWRIIAPWKYGYKSPKSIVEMEFTDRQPETFWNESQSAEYGFYSNVNPGRPHPRWSQKVEQDIGTGESRETLLYNGYAAQVGALYQGDEF